MKKYITTDKHPELKENRIIESEYSGYFVIDGNRDFEDDIQNGYIKELQEPKWTDYDMIDFIEYWFINKTYDQGNRIIDIKIVFEKFKKEKRK